MRDHRAGENGSPHVRRGHGVALENAIYLGQIIIDAGRERDPEREREREREREG